MTGKSPMTLDQLPYQPEALCAVRHIANGSVEKGTILARDGAWQLKYLVEYVTYVGVQDCHYGGAAKHTWLIGIRNLGEFYADGRYYLASNSKIKEYVYQNEDDCPFSKWGRWSMKGYVPVTPVGLAHGVKGLPFKKTFPPKWKPPYDANAAFKAKLLPGPPAGYEPTPPPPALTPEAQLEQFLLK
jgi:hypothetical protein